MFWHNYCYSIKSIFRNKSAVIWTLIFPIALATFMYMAFGNLFDTDELMTVIPVAVVEKEENKGLEALLEALSEEGEDQIFSVQKLSEEEALKALYNGDVNGIIYKGEEISLTVGENGYMSTIIKTVIEQYTQSEAIVKDIISSTASEEEKSAAIKALLDNKTYFTEGKTSNGYQNIYYNYFYAIFAMSSMFASFIAVERISKMQANTSSLGIRRAIIPKGKTMMLCSEFLAMVTTQFAVMIIAFIYMNIIGIRFNDKYLAILLILLLGPCVGLAIGAIIGSFAKIGDGAKMGICVSIGMGLSVMADLVASGVKDTIEHTIPILNRLNPAALISDAFYSLNVYDSYNRYFTDIALLAVIMAVLLTISVQILRRNTYASL